MYSEKSSLVTVKMPCGQGCGPGWVDCTSTLPEQILLTDSTDFQISLPDFLMDIVCAAVEL